MVKREVQTITLRSRSALGGSFMLNITDALGESYSTGKQGALRDTLVIAIVLTCLKLVRALLMSAAACVALDIVALVPRHMSRPYLPCHSGYISLTLVDLNHNLDALLFLPPSAPTFICGENEYHKQCH